MKPILPIAALAALLLLPGTADAVIRGNAVPESRYAWMADMMSCGGTLITPTRVLTAAHCVVPLEGYDEITLTLGSSFTSGKRLKVRRSARDPRYQSHPRELMARYDIAVLELAEPVTEVKPLPVAQSDPPAGTRATIIGHGRRRFFGLDLDDIPERFPSRRRTAAGLRQAGDRLRCRLPVLLRAQSLQGRLLRFGRHDLLARPAQDTEQKPRCDVDVGLHGRQRRAADLAGGARRCGVVERVVRTAA